MWTQLRLKGPKNDWLLPSSVAQHCSFCCIIVWRATGRWAIRFVWIRVGCGLVGYWCCCFVSPTLHLIFWPLGRVHTQRIKRVNSLEHNVFVCRVRRSTPCLLSTLNGLNTTIELFVRFAKILRVSMLSRPIFSIQPAEMLAPIVTKDMQLFPSRPLPAHVKNGK